MNLIEIERKRSLKPNNLKKLFARLAELNYVKKGNLHEIDTYYTRSDIDYMKTVECLRVRQRDNFAEITYKPASTKHTDNGKGIITKRELNAVLADDKQAILANELLETIGLIKLAVVDKSRQTFCNDKDSSATIAIDTIANAGDFIEVEVMSSDIESAKSKLADLEIELGINDCEVVTIPYRDIVVNKASEKL
jgi:adenylate cyclase class 2